MLDGGAGSTSQSLSLDDSSPSNRENGEAIDLPLLGLVTLVPLAVDDLPLPRVSSAMVEIFSSMFIRAALARSSFFAFNMDFCITVINIGLCGTDRRRDGAGVAWYPPGGASLPSLASLIGDMLSGISGNDIPPAMMVEFFVLIDGVLSPVLAVLPDELDFCNG